MRGRNRVAVALLATGLLLTASACSSSSGSRTATTNVLSSPDATCSVPHVTQGTPSSAAPSGTIRVLAAASLTESFGALAKRFEARNPGTKVDLSFGASTTLVAQVHQGAPADVLATADTVTMGRATRAGDVQTPVSFACNRLAILVDKGNPKDIHSLADLGRSGVRFTVCAAPVPCGRLARQALARAGVDARPVGSEKDVKTVVAKVEQGEVDAGIVYVTDAVAARDKTDSVTIPSSQNVVTTYPIAITADTDNAVTAEAFEAFVLSDSGEKVLAADGFTRS